MRWVLAFKCGNCSIQSNLNLDLMNQVSNSAEHLGGQVKSITAQAFAAKYSSKVEVYRFLSTDCGIYLPHKDNCTIWFLRSLAMGTRTRIKCTDLKVLNVP